MSKIALTPDASGTGTFTIASPNSNTNRTLMLPDESGVVLTSASNLAAAQLTGDVAAARITTALNATGSAPVYACRAWVNFNGTGTVAIRASGNVSSVTDNGTGDYTVNFATAMPDANYSAVGSTGVASGNVGLMRMGDANGQTYTTTQLRVRTTNEGGTAYVDTLTCNVAIFR